MSGTSLFSGDQISAQSLNAATASKPSGMTIQSVPELPFWRLLTDGEKIWCRVGRVFYSGAAVPCAAVVAEDGLADTGVAAGGEVFIKLTRENGAVASWTFSPEGGADAVSIGTDDNLSNPKIEGGAIMLGLETTPQAFPSDVVSREGAAGILHTSPIADINASINGFLCSSGVFGGNNHAGLAAANPQILNSNVNGDVALYILGVTGSGSSYSLCWVPVSAYSCPPTSQDQL